MEKEIKSASIVLSVEEANQLIGIVDAWLKNTGLNGADLAAYFFHKIRAPFQPKSPKAEKPEGVSENEDKQESASE